MDHTVTALERAFQLAKSDGYTSVADIKRRLKAEGYSTNQIVGRTLSTQLAALIQAARGTPAPEATITLPLIPHPATARPILD